MIGGQLRPDAGACVLDGEDITGLAPREHPAPGVGRTFQVAQTFLSMTVAENVQMALISQPAAPAALVARRARAATATRRWRCSTASAWRADADRPCCELAYGDVKRVELAIALASAPKLLLMDEPTAGMAPRERAALMELTARIARERGIGVLFTEHDMDAVFAHADRILVLVRGEIIAAGTPEEVRANARVREVYLGDGGAAAAAAPAGSRR